MTKLIICLQKLESLIPYNDLANPAVSSASAGWHIEHSLLVLEQVVQALKKSNPDHYRWKFSIIRFAIMTIGIIPRGKGKAPSSVIPTATFDKAYLQQHLLLTMDHLKSLEQLSPNHFFKHPYFGHLKLKSSEKFMAIHTRHHLKIIQDLIKKTK